MELLDGLLAFARFQLEIPVVKLDKTGEQLEHFQQQFCFLHTSQKYLSKEYLLQFISGCDADRLDMFKDELGICTILLRLQGQWILFGPYVEEEWNDAEREQILARNNIPMSYFLPYKVYYGKKAQDKDNTIVEAVKLIAALVSGNTVHRSVKLHHAKQTSSPAILEKYDEQINAAVVRYDVESRFISYIKQGDAEKAIATWRELGNKHDGLEYIYQLGQHSSAVGSAILRTEIRLAAASAGVHPIEVDAISQDYANKMLLSKSTREMGMLQAQLVSEMCEAVKKANVAHYSLPVRKAIEYIQLNLGQTLSLDSIAQAAGISRAYLSRVFRQETGLSVAQFIVERRTEKAAELLVDTRLSVQDISMYVGYPDNNYFVKVFKKRYGVAPSAYRRQEA